MSGVHRPYFRPTFDTGRYGLECPNLGHQGHLLNVLVLDLDLKVLKACELAL